MSCNAIEVELGTLQTRRREQQQIVNSMPHNAGRERAEELLAQIEADIAATQAELRNCREQEAEAQESGPQPVSGQVVEIRCHEAKEEVGHDEPYLLIASFDMVNLVAWGVPVVNVPPVNVVKVGPWSGVDAGETHRASALPANPKFWDVNGSKRRIARPQDVLFLVALLENDGSSPDAIRGAVRTNLQGARVNNLNQPRNTYVDNMTSSMIGAIETARIAGLDPLHLNEDEHFGVRELALTTADLDLLNGRLQPVTKTLRFTTRNRRKKPNNDYTVTFRFSV